MDPAPDALLEVFEDIAAALPNATLTFTTTNAPARRHGRESPRSLSPQRPTSSTTSIADRRPRRRTIMVSRYPRPERNRPGVLPLLYRSPTPQTQSIVVGLPLRYAQMCPPDQRTIELIARELVAGREGGEADVQAYVDRHMGDFEQVYEEMRARSDWQDDLLIPAVVHRLEIEAAHGWQRGGRSVRLHRSEARTPSGRRSRSRSPSPERTIPHDAHQGRSLRGVELMDAIARELESVPPRTEVLGGVRDNLMTNLRWIYTMNDEYMLHPDHAVFGTMLERAVTETMNQSNRVLQDSGPHGAADLGPGVSRARTHLARYDVAEAFHTVLQRDHEARTASRERSRRVGPSGEFLRDLDAIAGEVATEEGDPATLLVSLARELLAEAPDGAPAGVLQMLTDMANGLPPGTHMSEEDVNAAFSRVLAASTESMDQPRPSGERLRGQAIAADAPSHGVWDLSLAGQRRQAGADHLPNDHASLGDYEVRQIRRQAARRAREAQEVADPFNREAGPLGMFARPAGRQPPGMDNVDAFIASYGGGWATFGGTMVIDGHSEPADQEQRRRRRHSTRYVGDGETVSDTDGEEEEAMSPWTELSWGARQAMRDEGFDMPREGEYAEYAGEGAVDGLRRVLEPSIWNM